MSEAASLERLRRWSGVLDLRALRRRDNKRAAAAVAVLFVGVALLAGCATSGADVPEKNPPDAQPNPSATASPSEPTDDGLSEVDPATGLLTDAATERAIAAAPASSALAELGSLEVKGRAPKTGYDRDEFGQEWANVDRNGCDTRNDILARDLTGEAFKPGTHDCVVLTGTLAEPYSGMTIRFQRGQETSEAVQIDHVVALSDAWQKGAQELDASVRELLANDPLNLLAVDGPLNMQKSDADAATWLPPNRGYRCTYVARQVAVKISYGLWVTKVERNAVATVLSACPDEPLPSGGLGAAGESGTTTPTTASTASPSSSPAPGPARAPSGEVYYENCDAVRAAGAAPIHPGDPGWQPNFDGNHDGAGCE